MKNKRIGLFTFVYRIVAIAMLVISAGTGIYILVLQNLIRPEFTYHGNDAVSGWATIFSAIGYVGGIIGKVLLIVLAVISFVAVIYWIAGLILNHYLDKNNKTGAGSVKGVGTALAVLTMIPGISSAFGLFTSLLTGRVNIGTVLIFLVCAVVCIGAGVFLLREIYR